MLGHWFTLLLSDEEPQPEPLSVLDSSDGGESIGSRRRNDSSDILFIVQALALAEVI